MWRETVQNLGSSVLCIFVKDKIKLKGGMLSNQRENYYVTAIERAAKKNESFNQKFRSCNCFSSSYTQTTLSTTASFPSIPAESEYVFPFAQCTRFPASSAVSDTLVSKPALDTASTVVPAQITILYATRRVIRINFAQLNLGQDHPRQSIE